MGFFVTGKRGTIRGPNRYSPTDACVKLFQGMKGLGTDEEAITSVVSSHTAKQRQQIRKKYLQVYKKDLIKELSGELSSNFGRLVEALMMDPEEYTVDCIYRAVVPQSVGGKLIKRISALFKDGLGKTEYSLLCNLFPRSNQQLEQIKEAFKAKYEMDMEERIALGGNDLPQDFCTVILDFLSGERQEDQEVDSEVVEEDAESLTGGGGGSEDAFQEMMQLRSFAHLKAVFDEYEELSGQSIDKFVEEAEHFSVELKQTYKAIILLLTNEPEFYADRLRIAIQGAGTDDDTLIRVVVLRSEVDLLDIMEVYEKKFGISLADDVSGDTSGDYKAILMKIIAVPPPPVEETKPRRAKSRGGKQVVIKEKQEDEEDEKQPEVEVKRTVAEVRQQRRLCKSKAAKSCEAPPTEEEGGDEGEMVVEEVVRPRRKALNPKKVKKVFKRPAPPPPEPDEGDDEEEAGSEEAVVEEEIEVVKVSGENETAVVDVSTEEDDDVPEEEEEEEIAEEEEKDEVDEAIEIAPVESGEGEEDEEQPKEPEHEAEEDTNDEEKEDKEEAEVADETTTTNDLKEEGGKGSTSPIISREL